MSDELRQDIDRIIRDNELIHERLSAQQVRITEVEKTHSINDVIMSHIDKRLSSIEETLKWIMRIIVGAIILALLGLVLVNSGVTPK